MNVYYSSGSFTMVVNPYGAVIAGAEGRIVECLHAKLSELIGALLAAKFATGISSLEE